MKTLLLRSLASLLVLVLPLGLLAHAQGTAFTYQGSLTDGGGPANGSYDLRLNLYDASSGGSLLGSTVDIADLNVSNGLFMATLDFGAGVFTGAARWLEIGVRTGDYSGDYTILSPRQQVTPAPYAIVAGTVTGVVPSAGVSGSYSNAVTFDNPANSFVGSFTGNGAGLTGLNAANISTGVVPVTRGGSGAGTASGARANLGAAASGANADIKSLTALSTPLSVAQGGTGADLASNALVNLGAASLTESNTFGGANTMTNAGNSFVGSFTGDGSGLAGLNAANISSGVVPVARGGTSAGTASGARANLGAAASGANSDINSLSGLSTPLLVVQGGTGAGTASNALDNLGAASLTESNTFSGVNVLLNAGNSFGGSFAGDGSGLTSLNAGNLSAGTLPGAQLAGTYSSAVTMNNAANSFVGGFAGNGSGVTNVNAVMLGGLAASKFWQLGGNAGTTAGVNFLGTTDDQPLELKTAGGVGINTNNPAGKALAVNGGVGLIGTNTLEFGASVAGKQANAGRIGYEFLTPGSLDIVGAGTNTTSRRIKFWAESGVTFNGTGTNALVTINNTVDEPTSLSFAAPFSTWRVGQNKPPDAPAAFDSFFIYQQSAGATRLLITSDGKVGLGTNNPVYPLHLANGAYCTAGGVWTSVSDRNAKEDFTSIQPREVLAKVAALPIAQWRYKVEPDGVRHLGPTAQDFHAAFGLGESDSAIGAVDADGVALAAIQGLNEIVVEKESEIRALKVKNQEMEHRLNALETFISRQRLEHDKGSH